MFEDRFSDAQYGILASEPSRGLFAKFNKRPFCRECQSERSKFSEKDRKGTPFYSNLLLGFSSKNIMVPLDVLIVGEAHGGGRKEDFREKQKELFTEIHQIAKYYRELPDKTFHQQQLRILLENLDQAGVTWVFTDLIKCFVWHRHDEVNDLDGRMNWETAIKHCRTYLEEQIALLRPRKILGLGGTVSQYFNIDEPQHGGIYTIRIKSCSYIHSLFPSRWTADQWAEKKGWDLIIPRLVS
jgi:hypothetical protein